MLANLIEGKLEGINFSESPNFNVGGNKPIYLVVHAMSGTFLGSSSWFKNPKSKVSAHFLVSQEGQVLQMVKTTDIAWHCYGFNHMSIGIEHEDLGEALKNPWTTDLMLEASTDIAASLCKALNILPDKIIQHSDPAVQAYARVHNPSMLHSDCGEWWPHEKYVNMVKAKLEAK